MKRYDPELSGPCPGLMAVTMAETEDGEYVRFEDAERLREALRQIAAYDEISSITDAGICPYGCDCPNIAQEAIKSR